MADPFAISRLPDLPNAGYATHTQRELSDAIMFLIRGFERDRLLLLETVIKGKLLWRKRCMKAFKVIKMDEEAADSIFGYFVLLAGLNPEAQKAILEGQIAQQQRHAWDKRLSTALRGAKDMLGLRRDIATDLLKARKTYTR